MTQKRDDERGRVGQSRRTFLGASALGLAGLGIGANAAGADESDGHPNFADVDHDHSGEYGGTRRLGESTPVESITVADLRTKDAPVVDVRAHGAAGDGETDDYEAIQEAFDEAEHRSVVYFPPGHYRCSDAIRASDKSLVVMGDGIGVSRVEFTGGTDGFDFSLPSSGESGLEEECYVTVRDLTLGTSVPRSGTAIRAVWDSPPSGAFPHLVVDNVDIRDRGTAATDEGHFLKGIHADNAWRARVRDVHYSGYVHDIGDDDLEDMIGVEFIGRTVDSSITSCHFSRCDLGVKVGRDGRDNTEGVRIDEATMVDCERGIVAKSGPWLTVTSSHFNGRKTAVELDNRWEATVSDCLFYRVQWSEADDWNGVHARDTQNIHVSNTIIGDLSDTPATGRAVSLENCSDCVIQANVMNGLSYEGSTTVKAADSTRVTISENIARDAPHVVALTSSSNNCLVRGNWGAVRDEGRLNLVDGNLSPYTVSQGERNNVPGDVFGDATGIASVGETYGQTFTVDQPFEIVELYVANFANLDSAATVTLYQGDPLADDGLREIDSERYEGWPNLDTVSFDFAGDEPGTYYLKVSDPEETPTWWWYELPAGDEAGLDDVGGEALIDRKPVSEASLPVTEATRREQDVERANFKFSVLGVEGSQ